MTATAALTEIILNTTPGPTVLQLAKGDSITVTTTTGETLTGEFVSLTDTRGLRFRTADGKYLARKMSVVADVTLNGGDDDEPPAELAAAPEGEATVFAELAPAADEAPAPAAAPVAEAPAESSETADDVFDADPMVGGKRLSEMRFAEVMKLAQHYKTPGRGVARIAALREGVAKAIAAEAGRLAGASA